MAVENAPTFVYVGNFTGMDPLSNVKAQGVGVFKLDPLSGEMELVQVSEGVIAPAFVAISPDQRFLYSVNSQNEIDGHSGGAVTAYSIDPASGKLTLLNRVSSTGGHPCHITVEATGRYVLTANYTTGNATIYPVQADGSLGPVSDFVQHVGSGPNLGRQERPHAHSINVDPTNRFALVCDLSIDKVMIYKLDLEQGKLPPNPWPWLDLAPGAGPRHMAFHPNGRNAYVINELDCTMAACAWDPTSGALTKLQVLPTLPAIFSGENTCAAVKVAPNGKFVYGSNRGHDSIVIYAVDDVTGTLTCLGYQPSIGSLPWDFTIDLSGSLMLVACQKSNNVVAFSVDANSGKLTPKGQVASTPLPSCVKIVAPVT